MTRHQPEFSFPRLAAIALFSLACAGHARADSGIASFYGNELAGNRTASGERFNPNGLTAAHRSLAIGTRLLVTNIANGRSVIVRVNDRGPFIRSRVLDVSLGAARALGFVASGTTRIHFSVVSGSPAPMMHQPAAPARGPAESQQTDLKQTPA